MVILIGHFNNDVFFMMQHIIENNQKKCSKIIWNILNIIYTEKKFNYKIQLIIKLATLINKNFANIQTYINHHLELCCCIINLRNFSLENFSPAVFLNGLKIQYSL